VGMCIRYYVRKRSLEQANLLLSKEKEALQYKIQALEIQNSTFRLNPHLFKNTLNSIQGYAYRTHYALEKLGGVLDYILYDSNALYVSIEEELGFAHNFIELNKIKLSPLFDLNVSVSVEESNPFFKEPLMAPLTTAHLIENAFKHGDLQSQDAFISIVCTMSEKEFVFTVSNKISKTPIFSQRSGIGKDSMEKRLEMLYGNACQLEYSMDEEIYVARLTLDLLHAKNKVYSAGR
jgi:LytS/YehU family sensor histidine kinase